MKTIRERASLAAWQIYEETILSEHSVDRVAEIIEEKMLEQKKIDIEKTCQWITEHTDIPYEMEYVDSDSSIPNFIKLNKKRLEAAKELADSFRKIMEEQI